MVRLGLDEYHAAKKIPIRILLDDVRSQHNVGALFRTADAFRLEGLSLCGITACPPSNDIHKTALGAEDAVPWEHQEDPIALVNYYKHLGYTILGLEQTKRSISLEKFKASPEQQYLLIVGNEVHGIKQELIDLCDHTLEIPQLGVKHSLNVSVATGIALWQLMGRFL